MPFEHKVDGEKNIVKHVIWIGCVSRNLEFSSVPDLNGVWIGNTYGTHAALVYAVLGQQDLRVTADLRIAVGESVVRYFGQGELGDQLTLVLREEAAPGNPITTITVTSKSVVENRIEATWESTSGAAGVLILTRHPFAVTTEGSQLRVPQLETRDVQLAPVRLNRAELARLVELIQRVIPNNAGIIVSASIGDTSTINFARDFLARSDLPIQPSAVTLNSLQAEGGAQKKVGITLGHQANQLHVEWLDRQWVIGVSEVLTDFFRQRSNPILSFYRRHFADIHFIAFLAMLIVFPDLDLFQRVTYIAVLIGLLLVHSKVIQRISRTKIDLGADTKATTSLLWPTVMSVLTSVAGAVIAILLYDLIQHWGWPYGPP